MRATMAGARRFKRTVVCGIDQRALEGEAWARLRATTDSLQRVGARALLSPRGLADVDCLLVDIGVPVPASFFKKAPALRYVGVFGTGFASVDTAAAARSEVVVTNVPSYATNAVAEFTLAAALSDLRGLPALHRGRPPTGPGRELRALRFGVVGLGRIGRAVALLARDGFGADVVYWSRTRRRGDERAGLRYLPLKRLLAESEVVSLHLALNPSTEGTLDAAALARLRPGALVVNFASAGLVDMGAAMRPLRSGRFRYIIDHEDELTAPQLSALRRSPNVRIYPPVGFETHEARRLRADTFASNVESFLRRRPTNVVNRVPNR